MKFQQRLPHNFKEQLLFMAVISVISVNLIAPLITGLEIGFSLQHWQQVLHQIPLLWVVDICLVFLTQKPAEMLASKILRDHDNSFEATMIITALCNVFLMSLVLTIVGTWVGTGQITSDPIVHFAAKWPRNFTVAFIIEAFVAQPIARSVIAVHHRLEAN
ncbi:hypothetical protein [Lentilactobacillus senioris]|uniref:hypothetical protein n=1 Tax=Lentilactobacillus senioris TaxID=931534 RepID=UPI003D26A07E